MKIFPEYKYQLKFNISPEEFINIMYENKYILDQKSNNDRDKSKLFTGYFNEMSFELKHEIEGMNSGNPKIKGTVKESEYGCNVELTFSLFPEVKVILSLILLFLTISFIVTFIIFIFELFHNKLNFTFVGPFIPLVIIQVFIRVLMDGQITNSIEDIKEIINNRINS